jgi:hypothetical protein
LGCGDPLLRGETFTLCSNCGGHIHQECLIDRKQHFEVLAQDLWFFLKREKRWACPKCAEPLI